MAFSDIYDYFGATTVKEVKTDIIITALDIRSLLLDIDTIWKNARVAKNLFTDVRKYRIVFDRFYAPDILYVLQQIYEFKRRKSSRYRIKQAIDQLQSETWLKSTLETHPDILEFGELRRLRHTLFPHQIDTLKVYNTNVPRMQLKGYLLSTPPGCLSGDTRIAFSRDDQEFTTSLAAAYSHFNHHSSEHYHWDRRIPTLVRAYTGSAITLHPIEDIVYSGVQNIYRVSLADGRSIKCTIKHEIMTVDGFIEAQHIVGKMVMCDNRHAGFNHTTPYYLKAVSIVHLGQEATYDIRCQEPHPNFSANGMIVHNSGKTIMSIALSVCLQTDVAIFIVPKATVTTVWYDGIVDELGPTARVWASTHGVPVTEEYDYYIFHYEALPLAIYLAKRLFDRKKPMIAIDESHNLNEISSIRTLRLIELTQELKCQHTIFATGTPIKALGTEMIPLLRSIDAMFTEKVEASFKAIFGATAKRANDILRNRLGLISHKIREDSYMTIPPPKDLELKIQVPNSKRFYIDTVRAEMQAFMKARYEYYRANMRQYTKIYDDGIAHYARTIKTSIDQRNFQLYKERVKKIIESYDPIADREIAKFVKEFETQKIIPILPQPLRNQFKDAVSIVKYAKMRVLGEALNVYAKKRAECAAELARYGELENIVTGADKKTIIFSSFIPALVVANDHFTKLGFKTLQVHGEFTKDITKIVNQFKIDPDINPLIATLQSLAASQTLTVANAVIFLDAPFREYIRDQALHRVFRIGQTVQTYIYLCLLDTGSIPNISTRSADILEWSQTQVSEIFGSATPEEAAGIVKKMHLNPEMSGLMGLLKKVTGG